MQLILIICIAAIYFFFPIFGVCESAENAHYSEKDFSKYTLEYHYTTGNGWVIIDSDRPESIGKSAKITSLFDPRFLRLNDSYFLNYTAQFVIFGTETTDETEGINIDAKKIFIVLPQSEKKSFTLSDMLPNGLIKAFCAVFSRSFRISQ